MPVHTAFDQMDDSGFTNRPKKMLWEIDLDDPRNTKNILDWLNGEQSFLTDENKERFQRIQRNIALYKGIQYQTQETRSDIRDRFDDKSRQYRKIVANHLFDLTTNRTSRLVKFKPAVAILPANNEFHDKVAAKSTKMLLDHIWYLQNFEGDKTIRIADLAHIMGESYLFICWNPDIGDIDSNFKKAEAEAKKKGTKVRLRDENGAPAVDDLGNAIFIEKPVRTGDIEYKVKFTTDILLERKRAYEESDYMFVKDVMPVAEARAKWPEKARKIKADANDNIWNFEKMQWEPSKDSVVIWTLWHKKTNMMEKGRKIVYCKTAILENEEHPFKHGDFPCERYTDLDFPGELHGSSFFDTVRGLTGVYNNLTNMILRNQIFVSHPKWMVPAGSVKLDQLGNDVSIVQYKGPTAPVLAQANPTGAETFKFRDAVKEEFQQISGVFGVSRGEPPPGIKAGVALQFLAEQENERFNSQVLKYNDWVRRVAIKTLSTAGDKYDDNDERLIRVMGKDNEWMSVFFKAANLHKDYDIRIQNSSALPQSKAARVQTIMDLSERFPDQFTSEQVIDMLDLGQSEKFMDISTVSVRSAEAENEAILDGKAVNEPVEYEDHFEHWVAHVKQLQQFSFKNQVPRDKQEALIDHVRAHEMLMFKQAQKSPAFAQKIAALALWPLFFEIPSPPQEPTAQQIQSQANAPNEGITGAAGELASASLAQQPVNPANGVPSETAQNATPQGPSPGAISPSRAT